MGRKEEQMVILTNPKASFSTTIKLSDNIEKMLLPEYVNLEKYGFSGELTNYQAWGTNDGTCLCYIKIISHVVCRDIVISVRYYKITASKEFELVDTFQRTYSEMREGYCV